MVEVVSGASPMCGFVGFFGIMVHDSGEPVPPGDFRELKRLVYGLLIVVCATRVFTVVIDAVDILSGDTPPTGMHCAFLPLACVKL